MVPKRINLRISSKHLETQQATEPENDLPVPIRGSVQAKTRVASTVAAATPVSFRVERRIVFDDGREIYSNSGMSTSFEYFSFVRSAMQLARDHAPDGSYALRDIKAYVCCDGRRVKDEPLHTKLDMFEPDGSWRKWKEVDEYVRDLLINKRSGVKVEVEVILGSRNAGKDNISSSDEEEDEMAGIQQIGQSRSGLASMATVSGQTAVPIPAVNEVIRRVRILTSRV